MAVFNIPSSPEKNIFKINSFLGVDFTSDINEIDIRMKSIIKYKRNKSDVKHKQMK